MSISSETSSVEYAGNGSTSTAYAVPFRFDDSSWLEVSTVASDGTVATLSLGSGDFTVGGDGTASTGTVTTTAAVPATSTVRIRRITPRTQTQDLAFTGKIPAEDTETSLDKQAMIDQDHERRRGELEERTVRAPDGETLSELASAAARAGKIQSFDSNGGLTTITPDAILAASSGEPPTGSGVPDGGASGQVLKKASAADQDKEWGDLTKSDIGLGSADNTADTDKPISTAQQAAFDDISGEVRGRVNNDPVLESARKTFSQHGRRIATLEAVATPFLLVGNALPPEYANNAAAVAGGLRIGAPYINASHQLFVRGESTDDATYFTAASVTDAAAKRLVADTIADLLAAGIYTNLVSAYFMRSACNAGSGSTVYDYTRTNDLTISGGMAWGADGFTFDGEDDELTAATAVIPTTGQWSVLAIVEKTASAILANEALCGQTDGTSNLRTAPLTWHTTDRVQNFTRVNPTSYVAASSSPERSEYARGFLAVQGATDLEVYADGNASPVATAALTPGGVQNKAFQVGSVDSFAEWAGRLTFLAVFDTDISSHFPTLYPDLLQRFP